MKLNMKEKKILYAYACPSHHNTVTRLKWLLTRRRKARCFILLVKLRQRQRKGGTKPFTIICVWRWTNTAGLDAVCVR